MFFFWGGFPRSISIDTHSLYHWVFIYTLVTLVFRSRKGIEICEFASTDKLMGDHRFESVS